MGGAISVTRRTHTAELLDLQRATLLLKQDGQDTQLSPIPESNVASARTEVQTEVKNDDDMLNDSRTSGELVKWTMDLDYEVIANRTPSPQRDLDTRNHIATALYAIGVKFERGVDVPGDLVEAARCYRRAADQGHAMAQFNLGSMYIYGRGVESDHIQAVRWYREAALQGLPHAQCNLGNMYFKGAGVEEDWGTALQWFELASAQGHEKAAQATIYINGTREQRRPSFSVERTIF